MAVNPRDEDEKAGEAVEEALDARAEEAAEAVQDDSREKKLRELFGLEKPKGAGRSGTDAELALDGMRIPFELKSATTEGVTTARDVGPEHLAKWRGKHWLIGFFDRAGAKLNRALYASPAQMEPWISKIEAYIKPDFDLAKLPARIASDLLEEVLVANLGDKAVYTLEEAQRIQKKQLSAQEYRELMDADCPAGGSTRVKKGRAADRGFSKGRMIEILARRWAYLTARGATLNNPHIGPTYYGSFVTLAIGTPMEARASLREAVSKATSG